MCAAEVVCLFAIKQLKKMILVCYIWIYHDTAISNANDAYTQQDILCVFPIAKTDTEY